MKLFPLFGTCIKWQVRQAVMATLPKMWRTTLRWNSIPSTRGFSFFLSFFFFFLISFYSAFSCRNRIKVNKHNNFIVCTLDKADTMNFVCNTNCSLMLVNCQNTLQKISGVFIFASISLMAVQQTLRFLFSLCLLLPDSLGETKPSSPILNDCIADSLLLISLSSPTKPHSLRSPNSTSGVDCTTVGFFPWKFMAGEANRRKCKLTRR